MRLYFKKASALLTGKFNQSEEIHISAIVYAELCSGVTLSPEHLQTGRQIQLEEFIALTTLQSWNK